jgi:plasmid maintenance system antidote protein VapI
MMNQLPNLQQLLFQQIKERLPENLSFVHEIAELLEISYDSAYRRIRGEKELSLEELVKIGSKFGISIDALLNLKGNNVIFRNYSLESSRFVIKDWLTIIQDDMWRIHQAHSKEIIYAAKDPPLFHYFHFPEIAAFKFFFWEKTLFEFPEHEDKRFRIDNLDNEIVEIGQKLLKESITIPTVEIWNEDTFNILFRQIEYYWISGYFDKKDDLLNLLDKLEKWVRHIQKQADHGFKFLYDQPAEGIENSFMMYENEVVLNDNTIFVKVDNLSSVYITYNVLSLLITQEPELCRNVELYMHALMKKSNLISLSGSKARNRFFNKMLFIIEQSKSRLNLS